MKRRYPLIARPLVLTAVAATVALSVAWTDGSRPSAKGGFHHPWNDPARGGGWAPLDSTENTFFKGSAHCNGCHGHDVAGISMVTASGQDVNVVDHWRSSMMANSARDPFWRAKVEHEVAVNPQHQALLEDKCTSCHAPMGHFEYHMTGQGLYSMAYMEQDDIAFDGVSCTPCHMQSADSTGSFFSGDLHFDTDGRPIYGPYPDDSIFGAPMEAFVNYTPRYGEHILSSALCAGCHTGIAQTMDLDGNFTGDEFVWQATYHEWLNSAFNNLEYPATGVTCQGCHVPVLDDSIGVYISANYMPPTITLKTPFGQHHFVGGNTFMLNMLKENGQALNVTASPALFDSSIERTVTMLQHRTLMLETSVPERNADTAFIDVKLTNLAGHRFPSGYPSRRAWVQLVLTNSVGDTLYNNGAPGANGNIAGEGTGWLPHYDRIRSADQVQIYELAMGDVNGDLTTVLQRAKEPLKDNRLVPAGFSTGNSAYDTTRIVGALDDPDFNHDAGGIEGSGTDIVHYHVPMGGYTGLVNITARVWYQSVPPQHLADLSTHDLPQINAFMDMFQAADHTPVLVKEASQTDVSTGIDNLRELGVLIFPNPVNNGLLNIVGLDARVTGIEVYDAGGRKVAERRDNTGRTWNTRLPGSGTYFVVVRTPDRKFVEKVVSLR